MSLYNPAIPQPTDRPSASQDAILKNFGQLDTQFGVEHDKFSSAVHDGKHKYVTLQRSAGVPPVLTDVVLAQATTTLGNPYFQYIDQFHFYSIPLTYYIRTINIPAGSATINLIDFSTIAGFVPQSGTLHSFIKDDGGDGLFSPFIYYGGVIHLPGSSGQLPVSSSPEFVKFRASGSVLKVDTSGIPVGGYDISLKIMGTAL